MKPTSIQFLSKACNGMISGDETRIVENVKIDSREAKDGDLFVCVVGEKNDGHKYIKNAYDQGCRCFLVSQKQDIEDATFILVEDTVTAFCDMAQKYLNQFNLVKIGVTGSVGKTTTKMLTAAVFSAKYNTISTKKNLNTDLGNALTSFDVDDATQAVIFEMGMDKKGEIAGYVKRVNPQLAIISNIGISHLERLGTRDAIADAKLEIVNEFKEDNVLVVNAFSDYLKTEDEIRSRALNKNQFKIVSIGKDYKLSDIKTKGTEGIEFKINDNDFTLPLLGEHNAIDAALAVAAGREFGISYEAAAKKLANVSATEKRLSAEKFSDIILIDDSYNASPDSVVAGIGAIINIEAKRRIVALGDMLELGSAEEEGYKRVGKEAAEKSVDMLICYGKNRQYYLDGVNSTNSNCVYVGFDTLVEIKDYVLDILKTGDVVLVKGSNSTKISELAQLIREKYHA